jgi:starch synthase (maltosyl-transferring)
MLSVPIHPPVKAPPRIMIEHAAPAVEGGRYAAKRCVGDRVEVAADVVRDGHEALRAVVRFRPEGERRWREAPLTPPAAGSGSTRWTGAFEVDEVGRWLWTVLAWSDPFESWREELTRKLAAGERELDSELAEGAQLLAAAAERAAGDGDGADLDAIARAQTIGEAPTSSFEERHGAALSPAVADAAGRHPDLRDSAELEHAIPLDVDRVRARFGSWYELFPRSWGGFRGVQGQLGALAGLGFDVLYLPPIHPIGVTNRKGANDSLLAGPDDPGSPWAIGSKEGGHTAVDPELGTLADFEALVAAARERGIDVALDFAINCSADHPWLTEHPEWFHHRPDGTLKYAENPPKRYQDIYNLNFDGEDWRGLWEALRDVVLFWVERGVRIFRVDNPHTKPLPFWEWLIRGVHAEHPEVIFLAEAFTHRSLMQELAKIGFNQSYTYFTWKNSRSELSEYVRELAEGEEREYFRPNFFVNTPDILTAYLQEGGRPAFEARLVLAATLSPSYGIYSGFEQVEHRALRPGSEEYLDSEKYERKARALDGPLLPLVERLNAIRRASPALQRLDDVTFLETENDALIAYLKQDQGNAIVVVVNIDYTNPQEGLAIVPHDLGLPPSFTVTDLLTGDRFGWGIGRNFVGLDPAHRVAHVLEVAR